jgi:predicted GNAT family N-acyltransferase
MAQSHRRLAPGDTGRTARHAKHKLDELDAARVARNLVMFRPTETDLERLLAVARLSIPGIAALDDVLRVFRHNHDCVFAVARKSRFDADAPAGEGFFAMLPLNKLGLELLALDALNTANPDVRFIAKVDERPAGIYMWGVFAPGPLAAGSALFMQEIARPQYAGVNMYTRPNTELGRRYNDVLGLVEGARIGGQVAPHLWFFPREPRRPLYDTYVPGAAKGEIGITVARSLDDIMKVNAIRNAVYIGEQECPYDEEYDGNDFAATHLLAYIGDEPVGCLRVRFFADFLKFERMAIRKEFRKSRAAIQLAHAGLKLGQKKGYRHAYAHSQARLVTFWSRFGFRPLEGSKPFVFSDYDYVEIVADIERDPDAVTLGADPYMIIRPEGRWHVPGVLEQSAARAATNPSVTKKKA